MGEVVKSFEVELQGELVKVFAERIGNDLWFHHAGRTCRVELKKTRKSSTDIDNAGDGEILAPMPGKVLKLKVKTGQKVKRGELLLVMEAMKMEYSFSADFDGTVTEVNCIEGDQVILSQLLVKVEGADDE